MDIKLLIYGDGGIYIPVVAEAIQWITEKNGEPAQLSFKVIKEGALSFKEGNCAILVVNNVNVFKGYIFTKSRDKQGVITVLCYDQLRYFKNKSSYVYTNKQAGQVLKMVAGDYNLKTGVIEDTGYYIPSRIEDNSTLFDIIYTAIDLTNKATGKDYVMFDDFGSLCLMDSNSLTRNYFVNENVCENFYYSSSIDESTYNRIVLIHTDKRKGINQVYNAKAETDNRWGVLQYYRHISQDIDGKAMAEALLKEHNRVGRGLKVKCIGDITVRGGCRVMVVLDLGDFVQRCFMNVKRAVHSISEQEHTMELSLVGGEFIGE